MSTITGARLSGGRIAGGRIAGGRIGAGAGGTPVPSGYTVSWDAASYLTTESAASFTMSDAEVGATLEYTVSSSGGGTPVSDSLVVASADEQVTDIDLTGLSAGTLTVSVTLTNAGGTGDPATDAVPLAVPLLLDTYTAVAAYSIQHRLRTAYAGSAIRVRRSSDNAEQDIGFSGNALDESALTTFVGADDGFVTTFYDQAGAAAGNFVQTTASKQAKIVVSGVVVKTGSVITPQIPSASGAGYGRPVSSVATTDIYTVFRSAEALSIIVTSQNASIVAGNFENGNASTTLDLDSGASVSYRANGAAISPVTQDGLHDAVSTDAVVLSTISALDLSLYTTLRWFGYPSFTDDLVRLAEWIEFSSSADQTAIESDIASRYGIALP